ncbi:PH domain-containing protein [Micromonospora auratinigra]|uniref:PH domain-containing protein n=1 Tax=Micromonospora auratinigra TaxID=261654 RepID=A0A1A8ZNJ5_9ACTN|nr:PH domain-containing protein [Micromonospora auratinigra]SBT45670.1 PH domain-containing protein [Micromonospora auratinigra]
MMHLDADVEARGWEMELHRSRGNLPLAVICLVAGVMVLGLAVEGSTLRLLVALAVVLIAGRVLVGALRPFRFVIGPDGLDVRRPGLRGTYPWQHFAALALDDAGRLVGVPGTGPAGLRTDARHPVDGRPAVELLDLRQVRESPDEVVAALTRWSGGRFLDARTPAAAQPAGGPIEFTTGLRGYDKIAVDRLVGRAQAALAQGGPAERRAARAEIEQARAGGGLLVALRGYNTGQVDEALDALCAALTDTDTPTDRTAPA